MYAHNNKLMDQNSTQAEKIKTNSVSLFERLNHVDKITLIFYVSIFTGN